MPYLWQFDQGKFQKNNSGCQLGACHYFEKVFFPNLGVELFSSVRRRRQPNSSEVVPFERHMFTGIVMIPIFHMVLAFMITSLKIDYLAWTSLLTKDFRCFMFYKYSSCVDALVFFIVLLISFSKTYSMCISRPEESNSILSDQSMHRNGFCLVVGRFFEDQLIEQEHRGFVWSYYWGLAHDSSIAHQYPL